MIIILWVLGALLISFKFLKPGESIVLRIFYSIGLTMILGWLWVWILADRQLLAGLMGPVTVITLIRLLKMGKAAKALS